MKLKKNFKIQKHKHFNQFKSNLATKKFKPK